MEFLKIWVIILHVIGIALEIKARLSGLSIKKKPNAAYKRHITYKFLDSLPTAGKN